MLITKSSLQEMPFARSGGPQRGESASGATVALSSCVPACPACGAADCHQDAGVNGLARYRCQHCFKLFSISSVTRRTRRDEYERWLADIAS